MAPTPLAAPFKLMIRYTVSSLQHACNLLVDAGLDVGDPTGYALHRVAPLGDLGLSNAITEFVDLAKALYHTSVNFDDATLYELSGTLYIPRYQGAIGVAGTRSVVSALCEQATFTFRDSAYHIDKVVMLETVYAAVARYTDLSGTDPWQLFAKDFVNTGSGHIGAWYKSRNNSPMASFTSWVNSYNRRLRRERGVA